MDLIHVVHVALCLALSVTQCLFKEFRPAGGGGGEGGGANETFFTKNRKNNGRQGLPESRDRRVFFIVIKLTLSSDN